MTKQIIYIVLLIIAMFFIGFFTGRQGNNRTAPRNTVKIDTVYRTDTIRTSEVKYYPKDRIKIINNFDTITVANNDTTFNGFSFSDGVSGEKDSIKYSVIHTISVQDSIKSVWDVEITPKIKEIIKTDIREITKPLPFYKDGWFYGTVAGIVIAILSLIK